MTNLVKNMSTAGKLLQVLLVGLSLIVLGLGVAVCALSVFMQSDESVLAPSILVIGVFTLLVGIFGAVGACCRSKSLLSTYAALTIVLILAQCVTGGLSISTSQDDDHMLVHSSQIWSRLPNELRNSYQSQNNCCGFTLPIDRPGDNCRLRFPCAVRFMDTVQSSFYSVGILLVVAAVLEVIAVIIALVFVIDSSKRVSGFGRAYD